MYNAEKTKVIRVVGHQKPDTDSICSSIAYAYLKNQTCPEEAGLYQARRTGELNWETTFALRRFGVKVPRLVVSVRPDVGNVDIRTEPAIRADIPLLEAWKQMTERSVYLLCAVDDGGHLQGGLSITDVTSANMAVRDKELLGKARTPVRNLAYALEGEILCGDPDMILTSGRMLVGTGHDQVLQMVRRGDVVIAADRHKVQRHALEQGAKVLILCEGAELLPSLRKKAQEAGCAVIATRQDLFAVVRLISLAAPVSYFMTPAERLLSFSTDTPVEEAQSAMQKTRHRYFPIVDRQGCYCGVVSRRNMLSVHPKKVILVDHNDPAKSVEHLDQAKILEVIDHHRVASLETGEPTYFRSEPVGSTATIIWRIYREHHLDIPADMAGLLLSGILSSTLLFNKPSCTEMDRQAARDLAERAGVQLESYARELFAAGEDISGLDADDILHQDYKDYELGDTGLAVGHGSFMSREAFGQTRNLMADYLPAGLARSGQQMLLYMLVSVPRHLTLLLCAGEDADEAVERAFHVKVENHRAELPGVVSRSEQLIPALREVLLRRAEWSDRELI